MLTVQLTPVDLYLWDAASAIEEADQRQHRLQRLAKFLEAGFPAPQDLRWMFLRASGWSQRIDFRGLPADGQDLDFRKCSGWSRPRMASGWPQLTAADRSWPQLTAADRSWQRRRKLHKEYASQLQQVQAEMGGVPSFHFRNSLKLRMATHCYRRHDFSGWCGWIIPPDSQASAITDDDEVQDSSFRSFRCPMEAEGIPKDDLGDFLGKVKPWKGCRLMYTDVQHWCKYNQISNY